MNNQRKPHELPGEIPLQLELSDITHHDKTTYYRAIRYQAANGYTVEGTVKYYHGGATLIADLPLKGLHFYSGHAAFFSMPYMRKHLGDGTLTARGVDSIVELAEKVARTFDALLQHSDALTELYMECQYSLASQEPTDRNDLYQRLKPCEHQMNQYIGLRHYWNGELLKAVGAWVENGGKGVERGNG